MSVLVTGVNGQLGYDIVKELTAGNIPCKGVDISDFDITDRDAVFSAIKTYSPVAVIHCAAYTAVDKAEDEPERCYEINVDGTRNIAEACAKYNVNMMYISTDYVFPCSGDGFYMTNDTTAPVNVYGKSKLDGELVVKSLLEKFFIVRISWVFGKNGNNFIKTMLRIGKERDSINVVNDQIGSPTYTADLAPLLCEIINTNKYGIYHATNEGTCSWAEFADEIFRIAGYTNVTVCHVPTSQYPTKATRPPNSRLDKSCLDDAGFARLPAWQDAVRRYMQTLETR
ncbi:MAG: dTDP-4-dehydrorhamnose reductase [Defluviitaleaceae bacterium]|nr:dTDP-4-dehydrorhamnose reductase [Defluviitaleaceae bacterium]